MEQTGTNEAPEYIAPHPIIASLSPKGLEKDDGQHYLDTIKNHLGNFAISASLKSMTIQKLDELKTKLDNLPKMRGHFPGPYYGFDGKVKHELLKFFNNTELKTKGKDGKLDTIKVKEMNAILQDLLNNPVAGGRRKTRRRASRRTKRRRVGKKH